MLRALGLSLRFLAPLALTLGLIGYASLPMADRLLSGWFVADLEQRAGGVTAAVQALAGQALAAGDVDAVRRLFAQVGDGRPYVLGLCDAGGHRLLTSAPLPPELSCPSGNGEEGGRLWRLPSGLMYVAYAPLQTGDTAVGSLLVAQDASFIEGRTADLRRYLLGLFALLGLVMTAIAMAIAKLSWRGWLAGARELINDLVLHRPPPGDQTAAPPLAAAAPELRPLLQDVQALLQEREQDHRLRDELALDWSPATLRQLLREQLAGDEIIVVSNREPYLHVRTPAGIAVRRPASGLVTAVEPVMRACSGTWIAHGSGSADREVVDADSCVRVPPQHPAYTLKRIWLSKEEERGYYYGFANEGLWPLCHIAHVRPVFRLSDWQAYQRINRRFADAVCQAARTANPVVLVQDYHFALAPRMIRERLPLATIISFWHIPWPNEESFGICPWGEEILDGLLGSTIVGFHTPRYCAHFIEAVDRWLETRVEREHSLVSHGGRVSRIEPYPISIAWPTDEARADWPSVAQCRSELRKRLSVPEDHLLGLGVDRLDYTKGIIERLQAVERVLEKFPDLVGRFSFVQIAAPSRTSLDAYQNLEARVRALALAINERYGEGSYQPVRLLIEHHDSDSVTRHYRGCDVCVVTSLHDGMNLVAKEFIAARDDDQGALVLSRFAGAARELHEALIVNPYSIEQTAAAIYHGLTMPPEEQRLRMASLRALVRDFNIYRWAGRMLMDAARLRERERLAERIGTAENAPPQAGLQVVR